MNRFSFLVLISVVLMLALAAPAQAATVVVPGLPPVAVPDPPYSGAVLHLAMDEGSGNVTYNAVDPTVNNGTIYGAQWVPGKFVNALYFNSSTYITLSQPFNTSKNFTFLFFLKPNAITYGTIIDQSTYNTEGFKIYAPTPSGGIRFAGNVNGRWVAIDTQGGLFSTNKWYFVVVRYLGDKIDFFVNGEKIYSSQVNGYVTKTNNKPRIGLTLANTDGLNGTVDEMMFFSRALSDEEIQLLYQRGASHRLDVAPNLRQITVPRLNLSSSSVASVSFELSAPRSDALLPIPVAARNLNVSRWATNIDGGVLTIDDNRYINASAVSFEIPIRLDTSTALELPSELYLDQDTKTFEFKSSVRLSNPSDINVMAALSFDPSRLGVSQVYLDGSIMSMVDGQLISPVSLSPGEERIMDLAVAISVAKQEIEYRSTLDDFFEIDSFEEALTFAQSASQGKLETVTRVIRIEAANFGNRSIVVPLDAKAKDVIEARAMTGNKELLEVRERNGRAEIIVPASVFDNPVLDLKRAEIKVIYTKKPAWYERIPILRSLFNWIKSKWR